MTQRWPNSDIGWGKRRTAQPEAADSASSAASTQQAEQKKQKDWVGSWLFIKILDLT